LIEEALLIESSNTFIITIIMEHYLPYDGYLKLQEALSLSNYTFNVLLKSKVKTYPSDLVIEYYQKILNKNYVNETNTFLNKIEYRYEDGDLNIIFPSEGILLLFEQYKNKMMHQMELAGFNLLYYYEVNENHHLNEEINQLVETKNHIFDINKEPSKPLVKSTTEVQKNKQVTYRKSLNDLSKYDVYPISELYDEHKEVAIEGYVFSNDIIKTRMNKHIQTLKITDFNDSIILKRFEGRGLTLEDLQSVDKGMWIKAVGDVRYDDYANEHVLFLQALEVIPSLNVAVFDTAIEKRVELHLHTNMSAMDGINKIGDYLKQASIFGHTALALTDHNNVQAYPDAQHQAFMHKIKLIYGLESNVIDDELKIVFNPIDIPLNNACYVHFDFETTGLSSEHDQIIEIGAIKYQNGLEIDRFQTFVKPSIKVPLFIKQLTGIDDYHLLNAPTITEILPDFRHFYEDCILVAHNATFDLGFLNKALVLNGFTRLKQPVIDTLQLSRALASNRKIHNLGACAKYYNVAYDTDIAHRADYDAYVLAFVYEAMVNDLSDKFNITNLNQINELCDEAFLLRQRPFHSSLNCR
ncbi:MAG: exonuclease domain-containing protein, partial [Bacilli bacterium]